MNQQQSDEMNFTPPSTPNRGSDDLITPPRVQGVANAALLFHSPMSEVSTPLANATSVDLRNLCADLQRKLNNANSELKEAQDQVSNALAQRNDAEEQCAKALAQCAEVHTQAQQQHNKAQVQRNSLEAKLRAATEKI